MHFEILVEGQSELTALSILIPKIVGEYGNPHTWKTHKHRGLGRLPDAPENAPNPADPTLLHQLPAKLRAYSKTPEENRIVIVLLDLDDKNMDTFLRQLNHLLVFCENDFKPLFEFAVEELEAWYLGDRNALLLYNPNMRLNVLEEYQQDAICGTWELLLKADDPALLRQGKRNKYILEKKRDWAKGITVNMDINKNSSPSFNKFRHDVTAEI